MNYTKKLFTLFILVICLVLAIIFIISNPVSSVEYVPDDAVPELTESTTAAVTEVITEPVLIDTPTMYKNLFCYEFDSVEQTESFINNVDAAVNRLVTECSTADKYTAEAISSMIEEIDRLTAEQTTAVRIRDRLTKWDEKETEYYYATRTWKFLKSLGYSDVACAGILGNVMTECGGATLDIEPVIYDAFGEYYGMFQWSTFYYPGVADAEFEEQLEYYAQTSLPVFETWGKNYKCGFTIEDFNMLTDPKETALAFAKIYERCAAWTYEKRQNAAEVAYEYFVLDFENIDS